jgi:hypothetical protein
LEELVKIVELGAHHVPVIVARLRVQDVLVGQQRVQQSEDTLALLRLQPVFRFRA